MEKSILDWKDTAQGFYDKSVTLAILIMILVFILSPPLDTQTTRKTETKTAKAETILTEEIKKLDKPPEAVAKPQINIVIDTSIGGNDSDDALAVDTIESTTLDANAGVDFSGANDTKSNDGGDFTVKGDVYTDEDPILDGSVHPEYPKSLQDQGIGGTVFLEFEVYADGSVGVVKVNKTSGIELLDKAAIRAIKGARFEPAKANGKPVAVRVIQPIEFKPGE
jgi:TonB family protein